MILKNIEPWLQGYPKEYEELLSEEKRIEKLLIIREQQKDELRGKSKLDQVEYYDENGENTENNSEKDTTENSSDKEDIPTFSNESQHKIVRLVCDGLRWHFGKSQFRKAYTAAAEAIIKFFPVLKDEKLLLGYASSSKI